jgi:hypothetical protein
MTLLERLEAIETKITILGSLDQRRTEVLTLQERREKLEATMGDMERIAGRVKVLRGGGLVLTVDLAAIRGLSERIAEVTTAFQDKPDSQTLAIKQRWTQLVAAVQRETDKLESLADAAWEKFKQDECGAEDPKSLEQKMPPTAENTQSLARYQARHDELMTQMRNGTRVAEDIARIRATVVALRAEINTMQFDYPSDITNFLRTAMAPGGVPLNAITPSLFKWLSEHGMLDNYVVRRRN